MRTSRKLLTRSLFISALLASLAAGGGKLPFIAAEQTAGATFHFSGENVVIEAADPEQNQPGALRMTAYNGGPLRVQGYPAPVYVDLAGIDASGRVPVLRDHNRARIVGQVEYTVRGRTIEASGRLMGQSADRSEIETLARDGYAWQASVGVAPTQLEHVLAGQSATVNGQTIKGPAFIARKGRLNEISILPIGADVSTEVLVLATDPDDGGGTGTGTPAGGNRLADIRAERERQEAIEAVAVRYSREPGANLQEIEAAMGRAIADNLTPEAFELSVLRSSRPTGRVATGQSMAPAQLAQVVEASLSLHLGLSTSELEEQFPEPVLAAMDSNPIFRHGMSFKDALIFAAQQNGHRDVSRHDIRAMLHGAFPMVQGSGLSTFSLSGIFSNIANKSMRAAFNSVESAWRQIAAIESVSDFKTRTSYSLTGDMQYILVQPGGELKHAKAGEQSYTNRADTYGRMFSLDRRDIINDDLGALRQIPRRLGRGGALKLNDVFWTTFLANSNFFKTDNKNYAEGASTALGIDSLTAAEKLFLDQIDYDGKPLALSPAILLVATGNAVLANQLFTAQTIAYGGSTAKLNTNPHAGKFRPVVSAYLGNSAYSGYSQLAWYLTTDPQDLAVIEVVFLNGKQEPTVETSEADFQQLGVQMRGYHDFGVALQEPKAGVKMKGEA